MAQINKPSKRDVLLDLKVGSRVAEDEAEELGAYFVETDQWRKVMKGEADIILGPKGSGKSAIYSTLLTRSSELLDGNVLLISAENPRGTPAFKSLATEPPSSERDFVGLWKIYTLSLIARELTEYGVNNEPARQLVQALNEAGLVPAPKATLGSAIKRVVDYISRLPRPSAVEASTAIDPTTGAATGFSTKITLEEPTAHERTTGFLSADDLFRLADDALEEVGLTVWVLFDRLDVAFADSFELEANALRALFRVYRDVSNTKRVVLKLFLRSDIWKNVTEGGFRELSHISRSEEIKWQERSLLQLAVQRLLQNAPLRDYYGVTAEDVLADTGKQRTFFERLVPDQVDTGRNPKTFEWLLGRARDGTRLVAPRELIHLLTEARDAQVEMLERGEGEPVGEMLFTRQALRDALPAVSKVRLEQTIYAEFPDLKPYLEKLKGEKTEQTVETLANLWKVDGGEAFAVAERLVSIGFFEPRGDRSQPSYWVPFLYRPALDLVQGAAEKDEEDAANRAQSGSPT